MFQTIPLKKIKPSKENYRRTFDPAAMDELTASVKAKGVLQPILVRPLNGKSKGNYEIIAGHRRFSAAVEAGLKEMPAMVKELSDEEALEVQVIENSQREDPNPIDEALGFKRLIEMGKHTPETLAEKIDHSVTYVLSRLRLADLDEKVQDAIAEGKLGLGHALLFTRLKNTGDQKNFLKRILEHDLTVRNAKVDLKHFYSLELKAAPFDTAGCAICAARSGNQTDLFPEIKQKDECTDRSCYHTKSKQFYKQYLKDKTAQGFKTFSDKKTVEQYINRDKNASEIFPPGSESWRTIPEKYKSECMKCAEHHAFFAYEGEDYNDNKTFESGELCLNKKCLDAMQRAGKKEEKEETGGNAQNPYNLRIKAEGCRNRFLEKNLLPKIEESRTLQKRLTIYHLLDYFCKYSDYGWRGEYIREYNPNYKEKEDNYFTSEEVYRGITGIPEERLDGAIYKLLLLTFGKTDHDVMLQMTPEAGIDMSRDFRIDEEFLNGKTKDELFTLIDQLWPDGERPLTLKDLKPSDKKGQIVKTILMQELTDKVPPEIEEVCRLDDAEKDAVCNGCGCSPEECLCGDPTDPTDEPLQEEATADPTMPESTKTGRKRKKTTVKEMEG